VPTLLEEVTRVREAAAAVEATCVVAMFAVETFAWDAAVAQETIALHVKDAEDWATLVEFETLRGYRSGGRERNSVSLCS
jgi:hypothetical protein